MPARPSPAAHTSDVATVAAFTAHLLQWYRLSGRHDLPWKVNPSPYRVWLSEIMLQQTQVATVKAYFENFTLRFPDLPALASAEEDAVLAAWTGLGYYRRARNLHKAARQIVTEHNGEFPDSLEGLQALPGIGKTTAGAILALAFNQRATILDGNVKRVFSRIHGIREWPGKREVEQRLWRIAEAHTPAQDVAGYTQAIMDLGATLCTRRNPACQACPVAGLCLAREHGIVDQVPAPAPRKRVPERNAHMLVAEDAAGRLLMQKRPERGVWGGLWCFPELAETDGPIAAAMSLTGREEASLQATQKMQHLFTHYRLNLTLSHVRIAHGAPLEVREAGLEWFAPGQLHAVGLAAPVVRFLNSIDQL